MSLCPGIGQYVVPKPRSIPASHCLQLTCWPISIAVREDAHEYQSKDQRRKDKLAKRARKEREQHANEILPYEGATYQAGRWVPHVYATELAIYETILLYRGGA